MTSKAGERRRKRFIDKRFQARFIIQFCALNVLASLLFGVLVYLLNRNTKTVAFDNLELVVKSTSDFLLPLLLQILFIVSFVIGVATIAVTLLISHQISGPLYRLTLELNRIKSGDLSVPIRLRAKDQLKKAADESEQMRVALQKSLSSAQKSGRAVKAELDALDGKSPNESQRRRLDQELASLNAELARFKTD